MMESRRILLMTLNVTAFFADNPFSAILESATTRKHTTALFKSSPFNNKAISTFYCRKMMFLNSSLMTGLRYIHHFSWYLFTQIIRVWVVVTFKVFDEPFHGYRVKIAASFSMLWTTLFFLSFDLFLSSTLNLFIYTAVYSTVQGWGQLLPSTSGSQSHIPNQQHQHHLRTHLKCPFLCNSGTLGLGPSMPCVNKPSR